MQKLYSELVGMPVIEESSSAQIAHVKDLLIDPDTGKIVAFFTKTQRIIVPMDVEGLGRYLLIADRDRIVPLEDVQRARVLYKKRIHFVGMNVVTETTKTHLGKVFDFEVDTTQMVLTKLHVAKSFLFFNLEERIIPHQNIVKIEGHNIIVKDLKTVPVKKEVPAASSAFA